jgi:N-acetylglutamate synthase-like GNAT family acetyltransferase
MITISPPKPEDAEGMNEVIKLSWYATYVTPEIGVTKEDIDSMYAQSEKRQIEVFRHRAENPKDDDISLVAKDNEKVVGIIRVKIFADHIRVRTMYVHPEYMGKGVGTSLWNEMQKLLPIDMPVIAYPTEHTKSIDWYKKMGFAETGEKTVGEEVMPSGAKMTGIKMVLKK